MAGTCTDYTNTAVIDETDQSDTQTVKVCVGKDLTVSKTATASKDRLYKWLIDKSVDETRIDIAFGGAATFNYDVTVTPNGYEDSGYVLGGTITIVNPNDWEDVTVGVADTLDLGGSCAIIEAGPYVVPADDSLVLHYTCTSDGSTTKNTVDVTWDKDTYHTPTGAATNFAAVSFALDMVTNKVITVIDDKTDPANPVTLGIWDWTDGAHTFEYSLVKEGVAGTCTDYTNTAVIDETDQSDTQTVKVCVGKDLTVSKTAAGTFDREYLWDISKDADKTSVNIALGGLATFNYTVDVWQTGISDSGWTLSGVITLQNPNDWEDITLTSLTDVVDNGGLCTVAAGPYVVPKSGSLNLNYSCSFASAPSSYSGINTATATWDKAAFFTPNGLASGEKEFTLTQLGGTNKTIHVTDTYGGELGSVTATDIEPWATGKFNYTRDIAGVGGTCTDYDNTATITETKQDASKKVEVCVGLDPTVTKTADATYTKTWTWTIDKGEFGLYQLFAGESVTHDYLVKVEATDTDSAWLISGTIRVTNPNDWEAIEVDVTDAVDVGGGAVCTVVDGVDVAVPASSYVDLSYSCTFSSKPLYTGVNTALAVWDKAAYFTPTGTASGTAAVNFVMNNEALPTITVDDDNLKDESWSATRADAEWSYSKDYVCSSDPTDYKDGYYTYTVTNTATINETGDKDSTDVIVKCYNPTVTKTAAGGYERTYKWLIDKSVDRTSASVFVGELVEFNYTVLVTPNGFMDHDFVLAGEITVVNPHPTEAITVDVTDYVDLAGVTCEVVDGMDVVVDPASSKVFDYTCTGDDLADATINTVEVDWTAYSGDDEVTGTASATVAVLFPETPAVEYDKTINVYDDKTNPGAPVYLGEVTWENTGTFNYSITKEAPYGCERHTNTAWIEETGQEDSVTIEICGDYWAFTPGFWKNHTVEPRDAWSLTGYDPGVGLNTVFELGVIYGLTPKGGHFDSFGELTLLDALRLKGGSGLTGAGEILMRASVAALLNASFHENSRCSGTPGCYSGS